MLCHDAPEQEHRLLPVEPGVYRLNLVGRQFQVVRDAGEWAILEEGKVIERVATLVRVRRFLAAQLPRAPRAVEAAPPYNPPRVTRQVFLI